MLQEKLIPYSSCPAPIVNVRSGRQGEYGNRVLRIRMFFLVNEVGRKHGNGGTDDDGAEKHDEHPRKRQKAAEDHDESGEEHDSAADQLAFAPYIFVGEGPGRSQSDHIIMLETRHVVADDKEQSTADQRRNDRHIDFVAEVVDDRDDVNGEQGQMMKKMTVSMSLIYYFRFSRRGSMIGMSLTMSSVTSINAGSKNSAIGLDA